MIRHNASKLHFPPLIKTIYKYIGMEYKKLAIHTFIFIKSSEIKSYQLEARRGSNPLDFANSSKNSLLFSGLVQKAATPQIK